ncbi:MAG: LysR family transcriptional regulator [Clostridium sp.]|nr:LysR family transcriptional regulator [Clostridium sp.]
MNLNSLQYFLEVSKDLNMSRTARRLYLSQQALSLQIRNLEEAYGVTLFERKPSLRLTPAGEALQTTAEQILRENDDLINRFSAISHSHYGTLRIGISTVRSELCFPEILPKFRKKWPNIRISLVDRGTDDLLQDLSDHRLDLIFAPIESPRYLQRFPDEFSNRFLTRERTCLILSDELLRQYFGKRAPEIRDRALSGTDLTEFSEIPYLLQNPGSHMRAIADECFHNAGFRPNVYMESASVDLLQSLYPGSYGAFFVRSSRCPQLRRLYPDIHIFPIRQGTDFVDVPLYLLFHNTEPRPAHITDFIEFTAEAWKSIPLM